MTIIVILLSVELTNATRRTKDRTMITSPKGANIPDAKTKQAEMESLGWVLICPTKKGDYYQHAETKEHARVSIQGFAQLS